MWHATMEEQFEISLATSSIIIIVISPQLFGHFLDTVVLYNTRTKDTEYTREDGQMV